MLRRILLDPTADASGAAPAAPASPPTQAAATPPPAPKPADPAAPEKKRAAKTIVDPRDFVRMEKENADLKSRLAELEDLAEKVRGEERARYEAEIAKSETALRSLEAMKGQYQGDLERALAEREKAESEWRERYEADLAAERQKADERERAYLEEKRLNAVASALVGREIAGETPEEKAARKEQLELILSMRFQAARDESGRVVVKDSKTGKFVSEVAPALLDSPEFSHFLAPRSTGGSGATDRGAAREPTPPADPAAPKTLGELLIQRARDYKPAPNGGIGLPNRIAPARN